MLKPHTEDKFIYFYQALPQVIVHACKINSYFKSWKDRG